MLANVVLGLACSRRAAVLGVLSAAALAARPAAAQSPPYLSDGTAWIGTASACAAPNGWTAGRLFHGKLPSSLAGYCRYVWNESLGPRPSSGDVLGLFTGSGASALTEDAPVVVPQGAVSALEEDVRRGLRAAMHQQLGDVSLLPVRPTAPVVRIAVIDSAPDAVAGAIVPGTNRHGDTLAHLIEDAVCGWTQDGVDRKSVV